MIVWATCYTATVVIMGSTLICFTLLRYKHFSDISRHTLLQVYCFFPSDIRATILCWYWFISLLNSLSFRQIFGIHWYNFFICLHVTFLSFLFVDIVIFYWLLLSSLWPLFIFLLHLFSATFHSLWIVQSV